MIFFTPTRLKNEHLFRTIGKLISDLKIDIYYWKTIDACICDFKRNCRQTISVSDYLISSPVWKEIFCAQGNNLIKIFYF